MIKNHNLMGIYSTGVILMAKEAIEELAEKNHQSSEDLLDEYEAVDCELDNSTWYSVKKCYAIDENGNSYPVVVIGAPDNCVRLLNEDEKNFKEYYDEHPLKGELFNEEVYNTIVEEYKNKVLKG